MIRRALMALLAVSCAVPAGDSESIADETESTEQAITSYQKQVSAKLRRGSQPDHGALVALDRDGYRSIVNLRTSNSERGDVLALGMDPHHIGVADRQAPTRSQVIDFLEFATRAENQPVFVHCMAGQGRTGLFVAAYRMAVERWSLRDALREARSLGMTANRQVRFLGEFSGALERGEVRHYAMVR